VYEQAGEYSVPIAQLLDLTPLEFYHYCKGAQRIGQKAYELARWEASVIIAPHLKKGKALKPTDIVEFSWERTTAPAPSLTPLQIQAISAELDLVYLKMIGNDVHRN
jgi:hypothetical protein